MAVGHSKPNVHRAGKHHVLRRLLRLGLPASLAPRGEAAHVLVLSPDKDVIAQLLVSARTDRAKGGWVMNVKHEYLSQARRFYALVDFEPHEPVTYIVPSEVVSDSLKRATFVGSRRIQPIKTTRSANWLTGYGLTPTGRIGL